MFCENNMQQDSCRWCKKKKKKKKKNLQKAAELIYVFNFLKTAKEAANKTKSV